MAEASSSLYVCGNCDWVYDPERGDPVGDIPPGTLFAELPDEWICPVCGMGKSAFAPFEN